jgi:hypothetical protein
MLPYLHWLHSAKWSNIWTKERKLQERKEAIVSYYKVPSHLSGLRKITKDVRMSVPVRRPELGTSQIWSKSDNRFTETYGNMITLLQPSNPIRRTTASGSEIPPLHLIRVRQDSLCRNINLFSHIYQSTQNTKSIRKAAQKTKQGFKILSSLLRSRLV